MKISNNECTELGVIATITSQYYFKIKKNYIYLFYACKCFASMYGCVQCPRRPQRAMNFWGWS